MQIPEWMTDLVVLWIIIIILTILVLLLCIYTYIVKGTHSKALALAGQYQKALSLYIDIGGENLARLTKLSRELDSLVRDDQDLHQLIETQIAGAGDPTVLAMGGPDEISLDQD